MSKQNDSGKYWPYMILGFLAIGITLSYWTVKSAISIPVKESNDFMLKYQDADKYAIEIQEAQDRFNKNYKLEFSGLEKSDFKPQHIKRKANIHYKLDDNNSISFKISTIDGKTVNDANVTILLTRPQTNEDDKYFKAKNRGDGVYSVESLEVNNRGRYIIRVKAQINDAVKFKDIYGVKMD